jgi:hypothetical protein
VALFLQRIVGRGRTLNLNGTRLDLKGLLIVGRQLENTVNNDSRAHVKLTDLGKVLDVLLLKNDLYALMAATVIEINKAEILTRSYTSDPTAERYLAAGVSLHILMKASDQISLHIKTPHCAKRKKIQ